MTTLAAEGVFHSHLGTLPHERIVGVGDGSTVETDKGNRMRVFAPTWSDYVLKMPRGAQVVYPKDAASIVVHGDIHPGARVLEAGTGSGSLTLALLRAVGPKGTVHTFDRREDHHSNAIENIGRFSGSDPVLGTLDARIGDIYTDALDLEVDRCVLDLTEPWLALDNVVRCMRTGGILTVYMPTITQVQVLIEHLDERWAMVSTFETMFRTWKVEGLSVRPDHRMVAHTAFITTARLLGE